MRTKKSRLKLKNLFLKEDHLLLIKEFKVILVMRDLYLAQTILTYPPLV